MVLKSFKLGHQWKNKTTLLDLFRKEPKESTEALEKIIIR